MLRRIGLAVATLIIVLAAVVLAWYRIDGQPLPEARGFLKDPDYSTVEAGDGSLLLTPAHANGHGLLIMHGALIEPVSYAKTAAFFASRGYTVYLPRGALRLSITALDSAAARIATIPVRDWYLIGHSMGGYSSLEFLAHHPIEVRAVALWASAMPKDYASMTVPTLFLWGDHDGLLTVDRFDSARARLPASTLYMTLAGGNHRDFAMYSHQFFDREGTLGWRAQIDKADQVTAVFFASHAGG